MVDFAGVAYQSIKHPEPQRTGYRFIEFGWETDTVYTSFDLDALIYAMLYRTAPLGDGIPRLAKLRDAIDELIVAETRRALKV